jgi:hypothetical protein
MPKLEDAQAVLKALGLPLAQQNDLAGYTLLVLAGLGRSDPWSATRVRTLRIHDILHEINKSFKKQYKENTRESIRRDVIHQFEQARVVDRNPDDPQRPTNSGKTCYALTAEVAAMLACVGLPTFAPAVEAFLVQQPTLAARYRAARELNRVAINLPDGIREYLSSGKHNELQAQIVHEFCSRFLPGAELLYLGDTADKALHVRADRLAELGVPFSEHTKFPDLVLFSAAQCAVVLIEAVTTHGPCSPKRRAELELLLENCSCRRIYVTAFPGWKELKQHFTDIAWDTEVWLAEVPDHMIHFNGPKFLGATHAT